MAIPTEPIGSIPRSPDLIAAGRDLAGGQITAAAYARIADAAVRETIEQLEATGSPVITDGEQAKPSFATYPLAGLDALAPDGAVIGFADGHTRQLPRLTAGPFRYAAHAGDYLELALRYAHVPVKQAVIAASALSLIYPQDGIDGYPREAFLADLVREAADDIRGALEKGAHAVQIDFTIDKPSPAPPCSRVRERSTRTKRSKTCGSASCGIPMPRSDTSKRAWPSSRPTRSRTEPPFGVYLIALSRRLTTSCFMRARSPST